MGAAASGIPAATTLPLNRWAMLATAAERLVRLNRSRIPFIAVDLGLQVGVGEGGACRTGPHLFLLGPDLAEVVNGTTALEDSLPEARSRQPLVVSLRILPVDSHFGKAGDLGWSLKPHKASELGNIKSGDEGSAQLPPIGSDVGWTVLVRPRSGQSTGGGRMLGDRQNALHGCGQCRRVIVGTRRP